MKVETTNPTSLPLCLVVIEIRTRKIVVIEESVIETFTLPIGKIIVKLGEVVLYPDGSVIETRSYHFSSVRELY